MPGLPDVAVASLCIHRPPSLVWIPRTHGQVRAFLDHVSFGFKYIHRTARLEGYRLILSAFH